MNIYKCLNEITDYIEKNIKGIIDYKELGKIMGVNISTMQSVFSLLTGSSLADYIRKRRLSLAGEDLYNGKRVSEVAFLYGYNNVISFSRAFHKFHGINPSKVGNDILLKNFPRILFSYDTQENMSMEYKIVEKEQMVLYGFSVPTNNINIKKDAPNLFLEIENKYGKVYGTPNYGMVTYENSLERERCNSYWVLYEKKLPLEGINQVIIPKSKFLFFQISSQEAIEIQKISEKFYNEFLPSCKYYVKNIPELEYYHDDVVDFLVPID